MPRRSYTPEQKAEILAKLASGSTVRDTARDLGIPQGTVGNVQNARSTMMNVQEYKEEIARRVLNYANGCFDTLDTQVRILGDRTYIEAHGSDVFAVSQSHRIVGEQLARFLAAVYG